MYVKTLKCIECGRKYSLNSIVYTCKVCDGLLDVIYDYHELDTLKLLKTWTARPLNVWRYQELLPVESFRRVTLGEGGTMLYECLRLREKLRMKNLYVKNEGSNPTGSFKDRGMTVGVTKAVELGVKATACASTGNTSASLAAYSAKAGLPCFVLVPSGKVAKGKLAEAVAHGAKVLMVKGSFDDALEKVRKLCSDGGIYLLNSVNAFRLEGQKTLAYEVYEQLGRQVPDCVVLPVGNAGNISAIWKGFKELKTLGFVEKLPRMMGVQAEGASPFSDMILKGLNRLNPIAKPETVASAIRIGNPVNWPKAKAAVKESKGGVTVVSDKEIIEAQLTLAKLEGLFVEPSSAASIAGLARMLDGGLVDHDESVVCVATGHGLKDPDVVFKFYEEPIEVEVDKVEEVVRSLT